MNSTRAIIRMPRSSIYPLATYEMDAFLHQARQPHDVRSRVCCKERRLRTCVGLRLLGLGLCLFPGRRIVTALASSFVSFCDIKALTLLILEEKKKIAF